MNDQTNERTNERTNLLLSSSRSGSRPRSSSAARWARRSRGSTSTSPSSRSRRSSSRSARSSRRGGVVVRRVGVAQRDRIGSLASSPRLHRDWGEKGVALSSGRPRRLGALGDRRRAIYICIVRHTTATVPGAAADAAVVVGGRQGAGGVRGRRRRRVRRRRAQWRRGAERRQLLHDCRPAAAPAGLPLPARRVRRVDLHLERRVGVPRGKRDPPNPR